MSAKSCHIVLARPGYADLLVEEFQARWQLQGEPLDRSTVAFPERTALPNYRETVFARQVLPLASLIEEPGNDQAVAAIIKRLDVVSKRANRLTGKWTLHVYAVDDDEAVQRAVKLEKALIGKLKTDLTKFFKRHVPADDMAGKELGKADFLVQVYLPSAKQMWLSVATLSGDVSPYIAGNLRMRDRDGAPSRSARKLEEAFVEMGRLPKDDETAVDLGAAPGGWTFALARHGAKVTAVDNAALDLPDAKAYRERVTHLKENGLKYTPPTPVDWLCCDMVIQPRETLRMLTQWFEQNLMNHFVVNLKLPDAKPWPVIEEALALLKARGWPLAMARHLYHDRREITLMGSRTKV